MTLCSESMVRSAASTNARMPADETPCASGVLRGIAWAAAVAGTANRSERRASDNRRSVGRDLMTGCGVGA